MRGKTTRVISQERVAVTRAAAPLSDQLSPPVAADERRADADKQQGDPAQVCVHSLKVVDRRVLIQRAHNLTRGGCDSGRIAFGVQEKN
jgi:hypothetical protein